jgi:alkanesulfonate monooxygenase SsuD/methylene tetrahydromethanopterin reductase-like flavin-dependent oxidoreductase (luciferase family)
MRVGYSMFAQNYTDWDRFEAQVAHEDVPSRPEIADAGVLDEELDLAVEAESLGFDSVWTVEHHFAPYTMITNPLQVLSYLAAKTERVDLGTMVVVLPWHNPVRVAEDASMVQHFLGDDRQLYLGVGRGLGRREFGGLGVEMEESRGRFVESWEIIRKALTSDRFSYEGEFYNVPESSLRPLLLNGQSIVDNAHCAWGSPSSVPIAAQLGLKPLVIPQKAWADYAEEVDTFTKVRAEAGYEPAPSKIVVYAYCHESDEVAFDHAKQYVTEYADSALRQYEIKGTHFTNLKGYEHYAEQSKHLREATGEIDFSQIFLENHVWGNPQRCFDKIQEIKGALEPEPSELIVVLKYGSMPLDLAQDSTRLFAKEVVPAVQALD